MIAAFVRMTRRLGLWFLAAGITLAIIFISVFIYKYTVFEPDPPLVAACDSMQVVLTQDKSAEVQLHECSRGDDSWQGFEVWLFEPHNNYWQRLLTAELDGCMTLAIDANGTLDVYHSSGRGNLNVARSSAIYRDRDGNTHTLSINTQRTVDCPLE
ncbi:MAG TPA: hypothetical protein VFM61_03630 [Pseudidiomarina sp.]|nr:hypothetical protein [Pseudidiomarina sp.]